jgi:transposase InsO family protein
MGSSANNTKAKFIQVVIDHHSRNAWAVATNKNTATSSITVLSNIFKAINAAPKRLLTDNGPNFTSKEFNKFLKTNNIKHSYTSTYWPKKNGMNEKVNDTIVNKLRSAIQDHPRRKWSTLLPQVVKDYNDTIHTTTGFKPAFLMFGNESDSQIPLIEARALAKARTESFKIKKKAEYDKHHIPINFNI